MDKVLYRNLTKQDYNTIKEIIGDAFGFNNLINDTKFLDIMLNSYLQSCILESSYCKVAEKNNKVIGIILGHADKDNKKIGSLHNKLGFLSSMMKIFVSKKENKTLLRDLSKIQDTYNEFIEDKKGDFQGCIHLFIVAKEARGLGVGKSLLNQLFNYMNSMEVTSLYLYTDTRCNYGFYDSQNFQRIKEKEVYFDTFNSNLNIFMYSYNFL